MEPGGQENKHRSQNIFSKKPKSVKFSSSETSSSCSCSEEGKRSDNPVELAKSISSLQSGKILYENGDRYDGEFKEFVKNGRGHYLAASGWSYKGDWKDDKK